MFIGVSMINKLSESDQSFLCKFIEFCVLIIRVIVTASGHRFSQHNANSVEHEAALCLEAH